MMKHATRQAKKLLYGLLLIVMVFAQLPPSQPARAVGEAATRFGVYVPPSAVPGRLPALIVTALQDNTLVDITDISSDDGDSDDTHTGLTLNTGQTYITLISEGAVNDDGTGNSPKKDGDYFRVNASRPVLVAQLTYNTDWQHSYIPADNRRMSGTSFFLYRQPGNSTAAASNDVLDIFAYNDNTSVQILDITAVSKTTSGLTTVKTDAQATTVSAFTLQTGQDMMTVAGVKPALTVGHTYHIISNKDITVVYGSIGKAQGSSRDGGDYVPGKNGYSADKTFYFTIPYQNESERELRLVSYAQPANVTLRAWDEAKHAWVSVGTYSLPVYGHVELIGYDLGAIGKGYYFFEVTSDVTISAFEVNWLETGNYGTSDIATYVSAEDGTGAGKYFQAYMGPPSTQPDGITQISNLVVSSNDTAHIRVYDFDSYGEYIELYNASNQVINLGGWTLMNAEGWKMTLPSGLSVGVNQTFLLEYNQMATDPAAGFVYGAAYPKFKINNGRENLVLSNPTGTYSDTLAFTDTGWLSHGIYHALERQNPNLPFISSNALDSSIAHAKSSLNLGDYYGTPGVQQGSAGNGSGGLVINEVMSGRFYSAPTIAPNNYTRISLDPTMWEGLNNGEKPGVSSTRPENPYLIIESDTPVSVMDANWNDNWSTYVNGTLQPDPDVSFVADYYQRESGQSLNLTAYVENRYVNLKNPVTILDLPPGLNYTPGSYTTPSQLPGIIPTEEHRADGSWRLTWTHGKDMPVKDIYRFQAWGQVKNTLPTSSLLQSDARTSGTDSGLSNTYSSQDTLSVSVGASERTAVNDVVINEISPCPLCGAEWIELHNLSTSAIDLSSWEISDEDGFIYRFPPMTFIVNDGYLTVHLSGGTNNVTNLYTGQEYAGALGDQEDQVALYTSSTHSTGTLVDFVQWDNDGVLADPNDDSLAAAAGQWPKGAYVPSPLPGATLGRDRASTDHNLVADWDNSGGADAAAPTQGTINVTIPGADFTPPGPVTDLTGVPQLSQPGVIRLMWNNPPDGDFAGVRVVRSLDAFPNTESDGTIVYNGIAQSYNDSGLPQGVPVFYTLFTYDDKGNATCGAQSSKVSVMPPNRIHLVYEDQKGTGWVDWDTNDLVVSEDSALTVGAAGVSQIQLLFEAEARGSFYDHQLNLSLGINGGASVQVQRFTASGTLSSTETTHQQGFVDVTIFDTHQALPGNASNGTSNTMPGVSRQQGGKVLVIINLDNQAANPLATAQLPPYDVWVKVLDTGQRIHLMQAGGIGNTQTVINANSPLRGRDLPLALSFNQDWTWPIETYPIWEAYPQYTTYITSGNSMAKNWYAYPNPAALWFPTALSAAPEMLQVRSTASPALLSGWPLAASGQIAGSPLQADLNGDGSVEMLAVALDGSVNVWQPDGTQLTGWPQVMAGSSRSSPAVGDVDGDGQLEIVVGSDSHLLYAWHADGTLAAGFPVDAAGNIKSAPVLVNLDSDPGLEIAFTTTAPSLDILNGDGSTFPGWPQALGGEPEAYGNYILSSTPAVGDVDGDGEPEIVAGSTDGGVYAFNLDGSQMGQNWPRLTHDWVYASPVIVDLNQNGIRDVVAASGDGRLYAWDGNGFDLPGFPIAVRGGLVSSPAVVDLDGDGGLEVVFASLEGKVYAVHHDGSPVAGWPRTTGSTIFSSPSVGDLDGDGDLEVVVGTLAGQVYAWHHDGIPVVDYPRQASDWITGAPALGDFDGDGLVEVAVGSYDGQVYIWKESGNWSAQNSPWPAFHGGGEHAGFVETDVPIQPLPAIKYLYMPDLRRAILPTQ
jgi:LruC domain-containing protein